MEKNKEYILARLILRIANQIVKNRNDQMKKLGLTTAQADSLLFFLDHEGAVINDLRDHLCVTHQTARGIVQRMEAKGVVIVRRSQADRRYQLVSLSEEGRQMGRTILEKGVQTGNRLLHGMTQEEQEQFYRLALLAADNIEGKT